MDFDKQRGVALVIGLVMLLVLTIMGISSMSNTRDELKIACNFQTHSDAFQDAMSCVNQAISRTTLGGAYPMEITCDIPGFTSTVELTVDDLGCRRGQASSLQYAGAEQIYAIDARSIALGCRGEAFSRINQAVAIKRAGECGE